MKQKYIFLIVFLLLIVVPAIAYFFFFQKDNTEPKTAKVLDSSLTSFAQCLAEKEATMYGADWCPYCQNEKNNFGEAFKYVPYVECPDNPKLCLEKGIEGYPTWILSDGKKLVGKQGLQKLSQETGCSLNGD